MTVEDVQAAEISSVHAAEISIIRALRLIAIILSDAMPDMCFITNSRETPPEVWEAREEAWANVSRLLRLIRGTTSNIHDNTGAAFDGHPDLVDHCEAAIKEWEKKWAEPQRLARHQQLIEEIREAERKLGLGKGATS
jgi:hypothetical protein